MYVHAYQRYSRNSVSAQLVEQSVFSQPLKMKTGWRLIVWVLGGLPSSILVAHCFNLTEKLHKVNCIPTALSELPSWQRCKSAWVRVQLQTGVLSLLFNDST